MKSKVNARLSRDIKCNSVSIKLKKKLSLKRVVLLFFILIVFCLIFIIRLNQLPYSKDIGSHEVSFIRGSVNYISESIIIDDTGAGDYTWAQAEAQEWCSGSGTWNDPYIIESLEIDGQNVADCLMIRNSNLFFIIRDSIFHNSGGGANDAGLKLENVSNGNLININCSKNNGQGIYLYKCQNITISGSEMSHNELRGIFLNESSFNLIANNTETINYNEWGIYLLSSHNNSISRSFIGYNQLGLLLKQSNNNSIIENIFMENNEAYVLEDSYGNIFLRNTITPKPNLLFALIIMIIIIVGISFVSILTIWYRVIIPKKRGEVKLRGKTKLKVEENLHDRLSFIDYLIREKNVKEALNNLEEIKDLCNVYGLFELLSDCDEKVAHCNYLYLEMINIIKRIVINLATKFARLEIIDISEKTGISDEDFIIEVIEEMIQNNEVYAEYFSKYKTINFNQQSNIEQIEKLIKTYGEWERENLDRDDSDLLIEEILPRELRSKPIISKSKPDEFKELNVFLSYSTIDTDYFQISRVAKSLEEYPEINKVMYWEADSRLNIVEYMNKMLERSDVFVLFCSENSMKSVSVKDEWQAAFQRRKKGILSIIPVYKKAEHIPVILGHFLKVKYDKKDFNNFIGELYQEILRSKGRRIPHIIA